LPDVADDDIMGTPPPRIDAIHLDAIFMLFGGCMILLYAAVVYVFGEITLIERYTSNVEIVDRQQKPLMFKFLLVLILFAGAILICGGAFILLFA
jgi:hypothetical protein